MFGKVLLIGFVVLALYLDSIVIEKSMEDWSVTDSIIEKVMYSILPALLCGIVTGALFAIFGYVVLIG